MDVLLSGMLNSEYSSQLSSLLATGNMHWTSTSELWPKWRMMWTGQLSFTPFRWTELVSSLNSGISWQTCRMATCWRKESEVSSQRIDCLVRLRFRNRLRFGSIWLSLFNVVLVNDIVVSRHNSMDICNCPFVSAVCSYRWLRNSRLATFPPGRGFLSFIGRYIFRLVIYCFAAISRLLQWLKFITIDPLIWEREVAYYRLFKLKDLPSKQLYLYSKADTLIRSKEVDRFIEHQKSLGADVQSKCWVDSPHVQHLKYHPDEYQTLCYAFLDKILEKSKI